MDLRTALCDLLPPDRVLTRPIDRIAFANDASVYRLVPRAVVFPIDDAEVAGLLRLSRHLRVPLTFRAAGTSLSGQAVTDGVLAVVSRHWNRCEVLDDGRRVRVGPGVIGGDVNRRLRPHRVKIGPDPASLAACMMGGILANNSSGMCCGVERNAYHTVDSLRVVLPDGLVVDGAAPGAEVRLRRERPALCDGLLALRRRVLDDADLSAAIRRKYRMKNTMGYSLNALLDYDAPLAMLTRLMIGSEGTLGFIAEAVLRTVPDHPHRFTGLLCFADVPAACAAIAPLRESGAEALELMDRASLRAVEERPGMPPALAGLGASAAALLVEYQCPDPASLERHADGCRALLSRLPLVAEPDFTFDPERQAALWAVRKGLIPSVGAMRARGTSFIIEDVVFPVERLARGVAELQALFAIHGYDDAIVFGHAKDGNLHFVLTQAFDRPADVERYDTFMRDLAALVAVRYGGALKAEHGTGRNMAPFVATEWGKAAWGVMREIKRLLDPDGLLNPGVVINEDPLAHVRDLKTLPRVEEEVDRCIECGFCERMCPSREVTLSPRQRIVVRREIARLGRTRGGRGELAALLADWEHDGLETCAADGSCALACPVAIDTGELVKRLRHEATSATLREAARLAAMRFGLVEAGARGALRLLALARRAGGESTARLAATAVWPIAGIDPALAAAELPGPAPRLPATRAAGAVAVYLPSCVTRILGPAPGDDAAPLAQELVAVAARAGAPVVIPDDVGGRCCGMAFASKGLTEAAAEAAAGLLDALERWSDHGRLPVVVDTSPCALTLADAARQADRAVRILDGVEFAREFVVPALAPRRRLARVVLHPVCSLRKRGLDGALAEVASAYASTVDVPFWAGCCGFAGDRGFRVPALTAGALRREAAEIGAGGRADGCYSTSRTCEIGLSRATGRPWRSLWHLIDEATGAAGEATLLQSSSTDPASSET